MCFFFSSRRRHTRCLSDWSSDVCSSDLEAGFQRAERVATDGQPGVFATLDAGAQRTIGLYFMYDVKQVDPAEWSSPPRSEERRVGKECSAQLTEESRGDDHNERPCTSRV